VPLEVKAAVDQLRELIESIPAVIYEGPVAEAGGPWRYVSPQIESLLGYTVEEWLADGHLWEQRLHPADREEIMALERSEVELARGGHVTLVSEYRMLHRDGHVVWVRDEARLAEPADEPPYWRGVLIDITAERTAAADNGQAPDVYRITCRSCGATSAADRVEACWKCGNTDVQAVSLNATLVELAAARRRADGLLEGIHRHLEALATTLGRVGPPERPTDEGRIVTREIT
jgi:PAS domain S-box-containing protein